MKKVETISIDQIIPYDKNPRRNDRAVTAVTESLKQCDYINPIIVDENNVILAGDTRYKALKQLGKKKVQVLVCEGLTDEQKKKYRFLDNKTGEKATWNLIKLEQELEGLDLEGFDFFNMAYDLTEESSDSVKEVSNTYYGDGSSELPPEDFEDEKFKYKCPACGFRFN